VGEAGPSADVTSRIPRAADVELPESHDLLLAVSRFLVPGNTLLIFTRNGNELLAPADSLGWQAFLAAADGPTPGAGTRTASSASRRNVSRDQQRADAAVIMTPVGESTDDLEAARAHVNLEAIVAVRATSAELADAALTASRFRMVEWIPHTSSHRPLAFSALRTSGAGIAVARPR
jgi:hypothetical protein